MVEKLILEPNNSGRKNGFYKKISTIEIEPEHTSSKSSKNLPKIAIHNDSSSHITKKDSNHAVDLSDDETIQTNSRNSRNSSPINSNVFQEIKDLKQSLLKLEQKLDKKENEFKGKSDKIKQLEKISEKNTKKIEKIENVLETHQEQIIRFEGIFKEVEYKRLSELREQELLRPAVTERKMVSRHTFKDLKIPSVASSPKIKTKGNVGRLKSFLIRK